MTFGHYSLDYTIVLRHHSLRHPSRPLDWFIWLYNSDCGVWCNHFHLCSHLCACKSFFFLFSNSSSIHYLSINYINTTDTITTHSNHQYYHLLTNSICIPLTNWLSIKLLYLRTLFVLQTINGQSLFNK